MPTQTFEFIDFEPSENLIGRAMEKLGRIFGESPSDSSTQAFVKKTKQGFEGSLHVHSAVGIFVADVIGDDPSKVVDRLAIKIRSQLRIWKRERSIDLSHV